MEFKFQVDPNETFQKALEKASQEVDDLTVPLTLIAKSWFRSNKAIFVLKSKGKFADLSNLYKKAKKRNHGFIYPILKAEGRLERSITDPGDSDSINQIVNRKTLILGTRTPYAGYLQFGTSKMPARGFVLIGAEQTGPEEFNKRLDAWIKILEEYVAQKVGE